MKKKLLTLLSLCFISLLVNAQDQREKNKMLYNAILKNDMTKVNKLLEEGADANYIATIDKEFVKVSMLITAVNKKNIGMVKALIDHKADVNWVDDFNTPAIIYAATTGSKAMVELLLNNGADINANDGAGNTVLSAAKESKNTNLINFVKEKKKE